MSPPLQIESLPNTPSPEPLSPFSPKQKQTPNPEKTREIKINIEENITERACLSPCLEIETLPNTPSPEPLNTEEIIIKDDRLSKIKTPFGNSLNSKEVDKNKISFLQEPISPISNNSVYKTPLNSPSSPQSDIFKTFEVEESGISGKNEHLSVENGKNNPDHLSRSLEDMESSETSQVRWQHQLKKTDTGEKIVQSAIDSTESQNAQTLRDKILESGISKSFRSTNSLPEMIDKSEKTVKPSSPQVRITYLNGLTDD